MRNNQGYAHSLHRSRNNARQFRGPNDIVYMYYHVLKSNAAIRSSVHEAADKMHSRAHLAGYDNPALRATGSGSGSGGDTASSSYYS